MHGWRMNKMSTHCLSPLNWRGQVHQHRRQPVAPVLLGPLMEEVVEMRPGTAGGAAWLGCANERLPATSACPRSSLLKRTEAVPTACHAWSSYRSRKDLSPRVWQLASRRGKGSVRADTEPLLAAAHCERCCHPSAQPHLQPPKRHSYLSLCIRTCAKSLKEPCPHCTALTCTADHFGTSAPGGPRHCQQES